MKTVFSLSLAFALIAGSAFAEGAAPGGGACKADFEKFCKGVQPGEGRIIKCMKEHSSELSSGCQAKIAEKKAAMKAKREVSGK